MEDVYRRPTTEPLLPSGLPWLDDLLGGGLCHRVQTFEFTSDPHGLRYEVREALLRTGYAQVVLPSEKPMAALRDLTRAWIKGPVLIDQGELSIQVWQALDRILYGNFWPAFRHKMRHPLAILVDADPLPKHAKFYAHRRVAIRGSTIKVVKSVVDCRGGLSIDLKFVAGTSPV